MRSRTKPHFRVPDRLTFAQSAKKFPHPQKISSDSAFETFVAFSVLGSVPGTHGMTGSSPKERSNSMHIAQIAPLTEAIPPKLYGGTERVVSWLTEELIALGHEVTLFASGNSMTSAQLEAVWPRALRLDGAVRDPNALHMLMLERVYQRAGRFRLSAFPSRLLSVLAVLPAADAVRHDFARPARSARASAGFRRFLVGAGGVDLQCAAAAAAAGALGAHRPSRPARAICLRPKPIKPSYFAFLGRIAPEKGIDRAIRIAEHCGVPLKSPPKSTMPIANITTSKIKPMMQVGQRRISSARSTTRRNPNSSAARRCCSFRSTGRSRSAW